MVPSLPCVWALSEPSQPANIMHGLRICWHTVSGGGIVVAVISIIRDGTVGVDRTTTIGGAIIARESRTLGTRQGGRVERAGKI